MLKHLMLLQYAHYKGFHGTVLITAVLMIACLPFYAQSIRNAPLAEETRFLTLMQS